MFSVFLLATLRFGAFFFGTLRGGFFFGSDCLIVSAVFPASLLLRLAGAADFGRGFDFGLAAFFFPHRHSANALPAAEHFALFI